MDGSPRVSIVIATYNWATVLPSSIGSVLDQTFTEFELLVVGDGCSDESADVVGAVDDPRVRWINLPQNTGHQAGPNNEGAARASGDVIAYLGHDDLWLPHHLEVLLGAIAAGAPVAHTTALRVDPGRSPYATPEDGWVDTPEAWIPPTSVALPRAVLLAAGGWRLPRDTGYLDPEVELLGRVRELAGAPVWVPRLTCVKLSAGKRYGVYRTRPHFEQEYWLQVIRDAADPEAALLATIGGPADQAGVARRAPLPRRAWRSIRRRTRRRLGLRTRAKTRIRRNRRFKGL